VVGIRSHECALIGDDPKSDRAGAEGAGWFCSLVDRPKRGLWEALEDLRV
jgi:FMN phosphatase YigB (HAD superfamily)